MRMPASQTFLKVGPDISKFMMIMMITLTMVRDESHDKSC